MNKLTPIFIAGAIAVSVGLSVAQSRLPAGAPAADHSMSGMNMSGMEMPDSASKDDADVAFMRGMIPHHRGAIDMAKAVLERGADPDVRKLAEGVIAAQASEIAFMEKWLADHGE